MRRYFLPKPNKPPLLSSSLGRTRHLLPELKRRSFPELLLPILSSQASPHLAASDYHRTASSLPRPPPLLHTAHPCLSAVARAAAYSTAPPAPSQAAAAGLRCRSPSSLVLGSATAAALCLRLTPPSRYRLCCLSGRRLCASSRQCLGLPIHNLAGRDSFPCDAAAEDHAQRGSATGGSTDGGGGSSVLQVRVFLSG